MPQKQLSCRISIRVFGEEKCFGPGVATLLEQVDELKSLRKATIAMRMAYSKAWKILNVAEANLGFKLLNSVTGGKGGGGAELTPEAREFLAAYRRFEREVNAYAEKAFREIVV